MCNEIICNTRPRRVEGGGGVDDVMIITRSHSAPQNAFENSEIKSEKELK